MSKLKSIDEQWSGFAAMVFHKTKPAINQVEEMKKAFFAGAWAMWCGLEEIGQPHVSEEQADEWLDARRVECLEFKRNIITEYSEQN